MKKLLYIFILAFYACSPSPKKVETIHAMTQFDYFKIARHWLDINGEYLQKNMQYLEKLGKNEMTDEDNMKFNENSEYAKMAADSAQFYLHKMDEIQKQDRIDNLKHKYDSLLLVDSLNELKKY